MLDLHHASEADWKRLPAAERNSWQRLAARTQGIVTPANLISLGGAAVVFYGLYLIAHSQIVTGILTVLAGRAADIIDGYIAHRTGTKSPLGEAVDVTIDKITIF